MPTNDALTLRNCIAYVLDNNEDLLESDITELKRINAQLLTNSGQLLNSLLLSTQNALPKCSLRYIIIPPF